MLDNSFGEEVNRKVEELLALSKERSVERAVLGHIRLKLQYGSEPKFMLPLLQLIQEALETGKSLTGLLLSHLVNLEVENVYLSNILEGGNFDG